MANDFVFVVMCSSMPSRRRSRRSHTSSDPRHRHTRWQHHFQNSTLPIRRNNFVIEERTSAELDLTARLINTTLTLTEPRTREAKQSAKHTIQHDRRRRRGGGDFCAQTRRRYVRGSHAHTLTRAAAAQRDKYDSHTACCYGLFVCTLALATLLIFSHMAEKHSAGPRLDCLAGGWIKRKILRITTSH